MVLYHKLPDKTMLNDLLDRRGGQAFSYDEMGATAGALPMGYDHDDTRILLGEGEEVLEAARKALQEWAMFPGWIRLHPESPNIVPETTIALSIKYQGLWCVNICRIVYLVQQPDIQGFAYGTLPAHAEQGEEAFLIERDTDGRIYYRLRAFSRPQHWLAILGYPFVRQLQRRFIRDSLAAMQFRVRKDAEIHSES